MIIEANAMGYEEFIRRANGGQERGFAGARADFYKNFEWLQQEYEKKLEEGAPDLPEYAYKAGLRAGKIAAFMGSALDRMELAYRNKMTAEQRQEYQDIYELVTTPKLENINEALDRLGTLYPELEK